MAELKNLMRLRKAHVKPASEVLSRAFQNDPLPAYFFPDAAGREERQANVYQLLVRYGVRYGDSYATSPNMEGIAVWLPSERTDMPLWRMMLSGTLPLMLNLHKEDVARMRYFSGYVSAVHKRFAPFRHWYLQIIGIDPKFQGKGYASKLLQPMLARMDCEGSPCYLETQSEKNVSLWLVGVAKAKELILLGDTDKSQY